jgi:6-phosphogluconolactonase
MSGETFVVIGSLTREAPYFQGARGKGLVVAAFDNQTGRMTRLSEKGGIDNPSYLAAHPGKACVYASSEVFGWNEGVVSAYRLDPKDGTLRYINKQPSLGSIIAHDSLDQTGRFLFVANYSVYAEPEDDQPNQAVVVMPIRDDGGLGAPVSSHAHPGAGPNAARQERSHAHCVLSSPDNRHVIVADLGTDELVVYRFDADSGALSPAHKCKTAPGSGPRHFVFHPTGRFLFTISELDSTVSAYGFDAASGVASHLQTLSALPPGVDRESHASGLQITPNGRFLYGGVRGSDTLAIFGVDPGSGRLSLVDHVSSLGQTPRDLTVDPTGRFVLVANQNSDALTILRIDPETGRLTDSGHRFETGTPMCAKFLRA